MMAPKGEKQLHKALTTGDLARIEALIPEHPDYSLAAAAIAGFRRLGQGDTRRAGELLHWVFHSGKDPAQDSFMVRYPQPNVVVQVVPGASAEMGLSRSAVGLALAELYQEANEVNNAISIVEQLEPTTIAALSLSELYCLAGRFDEVAALSDGLTNVDDSTSLLLTFRGVALREMGYCDAAREAFKEALKSKKRNPIVRHRAWIERAKSYEVEGKKSAAKKDLERILAEDSSYAGLAEALAALNAS